MKKAVVFDLDGTILDTLFDLYAAVNFAMKKNGFPTWEISDIRRFVGNGVRLLIERSTPLGDKNPKFDKTFSDFKSYYSKHSLDHTKPYENIPELIKKLKNEGFKTAIVSNKFDAAVQELKNKFFPEIDFAFGEREGVRKKPFPDSTILALDKLGVKKEEAIFVGDSDVDFETANNAGIDSVIVTWGFRDRPELEEKGCRVFADSVDELYNIIKKS